MVENEQSFLCNESEPARTQKIRILTWINLRLLFFESGNKTISKNTGIAGFFSTCLWRMFCRLQFEVLNSFLESHPPNSFNNWSTDAGTGWSMILELFRQELKNIFTFLAVLDFISSIGFSMNNQTNKSTYILAIDK